MDSNALDNRTVVLNPTKVTATFRNGTLSIDASGVEDGVGQIRLEPLKTMVLPPLFDVVGEQTGAIGMFPYEVKADFPFKTNPGEVVVSGERYPVVKL